MDRLRNAVYLQSGVRLLGSGLDAVLVKEPSQTTKLDADSDWYDQEITLTEARGFQLSRPLVRMSRGPGPPAEDRDLLAIAGPEFG